MQSKMIKYTYLLVGLWTLSFIAVWFLTHSNWKEEFHRHVDLGAQTVLNKDLSFRTWATMHGGVYIPPTEKTPPNPFLNFIDDRDVVTTEGKKLTLMNPAYLIRQVMQEYESTYGIKGHITSLNPINPSNAPDEWETSVLKGFETNLDSVDIFANSEGEKLYRKMIPLIAKKDCLKCHGHQGYKEGDIRGGLSVTLPVTQLYTLGRNNHIKVTIILMGIYLLGLIGLIVASRKNIKDQIELASYAESLKRYEEIVSATQDQMAFVDNNYKYLAINDRYLELYGKPLDEFIGHHVKDIVGDEVFDMLKPFLDKCLKGEAIYFERWMDTQQLKKRCHAISYYPYRNDKGVVSGVVANVRDITKRKEAEVERNLNTERISALLKLNQMKGATEEELMSFALEECVRLTNSKGGYMHFYEEELKNLNLFSWSKEVLKECTAEKAPHYPLESAGIWADCIRENKPVIHNDFQNEPDRKGYPEGHFKVIRHMSVPVIVDNKIVGITGVGNKETPYDESDVNQLNLFMNSMWLILEKRKADESIKNSLKEKEVLLREVHHRVKNNMAVISSLLSLQSRYIDNKEYQDMFNESQSRIRSMALVHEKLYQSKDFARIDAKGYVETLSENIKSAFTTNDNVICKVDVDAIDLEIDLLVPCGLIINEILTNAYKHAFSVNDKPELNISMKKSDNENVRLTIADNGKGLPEGFDLYQAQGLGLKLVGILVKQINGKLEAKSGNGVTYQITFPSNIEHARHL